MVRLAKAVRLGAIGLTLLALTACTADCARCMAAWPLSTCWWAASAQAALCWAAAASSRTEVLSCSSAHATWLALSVCWRECWVMSWVCSSSWLTAACSRSALLSTSESMARE